MNLASIENILAFKNYLLWNPPIEIFFDRFENFAIMKVEHEIIVNIFATITDAVNYVSPSYTYDRIIHKELNNA